MMETERERERGRGMGRDKKNGEEDYTNRESRAQSAESREGGGERGGGHTGCDAAAPGGKKTDQ